MLVRRNAGNPRGPRRELMVEHEFMRGEAEAFRAPEHSHDGDKLFIDDPDLRSLPGWHVRKGGWRSGGVHRDWAGLVASTSGPNIRVTTGTMDLGKHFGGELDLRP